MVTKQNLSSSTPFVGRTQELAEIARLLSDPTCRLLTLVGPGGIGKTRLALEAATQLEPDLDGVYFVPLQPLSSPDHIVSGIAEAVGFQFYQGGEPQEQLLDYFREKALILILDNFEHLLDGAEIASNILAHTPKIKILATSREPLNLHEEWLYHVQGMRFPENEQVNGVENYSAVRLFTQSARRVRNDFSPLDEREAVIRICQLVEGTPLALELAAAWLKRLPCREIVTQIERGLDILETPARNVPARHRSMRAVFEHSWNLLTDAERDVFKKLSIFRGGFRKEAAHAVAGASLSVLSALVDKSLLRVAGSGRYDIHELLRQYGEEQLNLSVEENEQTSDRHCAYFAEFMQHRQDNLKGHGQFAALKEIEADFENIRTAWRWGLSRKNYQMLEPASESLFLYCEMYGRFPEGQELLWAAQEQLDTETDHLRPLWARTLVYSLWLWGLYDHSFEKFEDAKAHLDEYLIIARKQGDAAQIARCQWVLGALGSGTRNYVGAPARLEQSLALYTELGDRFYMAKAADWLAYVLLSIGQQDRHIDLSRQSLDWRRAIGDQFGAASSLWNLALAALAVGHYDQARGYTQEMGEIYVEMGRGWAARKSVFLAWVAFQQGDFHAAQALSEEGLAIIADKGMGAVAGEETALAVLGLLAALEEDYARSWRLCERAGFVMVFSRPVEVFAIAACGLEDYSTARHYFLGALSRTSTIHQSIGMANLMTVAAILLTRDGQQEQAVEALGLAFHHPASAKRWLQEWPLLQRLLTDLRAKLAPEVFETAWERGKAADLKTVATALLMQFDDVQDQLPLTVQPAYQPLHEPLSGRELEVLRLVAEGLSNAEIAHKLFLSPGTVKVHVRHLYEKLDVNSRVQAAARAKTLNLL